MCCEGDPVTKSLAAEPSQAPAASPAAPAWGAPLEEQVGARGQTPGPSPPSSAPWGPRTFFVGRAGSPRTAAFVIYWLLKGARAGAPRCGRLQEGRPARHRTYFGAFRTRLVPALAGGAETGCACGARSPGGLACGGQGPRGIRSPVPGAGAEGKRSVRRSDLGTVDSRAPCPLVRPALGVFGTTRRSAAGRARAQRQRRRRGAQEPRPRLPGPGGSSPAGPAPREPRTSRPRRLFQLCPSSYCPTRGVSGFRGDSRHSLFQPQFSSLNYSGRVPVFLHGNQPNVWRLRLHGASARAGRGRRPEPPAFALPRDILPGLTLVVFPLSPRIMQRSDGTSETFPGNLVREQAGDMAARPLLIESPLKFHSCAINY